MLLLRNNWPDDPLWRSLQILWQILIWCYLSVVDGSFLTFNRFDHVHSFKNVIAAKRSGIEILRYHSTGRFYAPLEFFLRRSIRGWNDKNRIGTQPESAVHRHTPYSNIALCGRLEKIDFESQKCCKLSNFTEFE
jgi:hypothetical protein